MKDGLPDPGFKYGVAGLLSALAAGAALAAPRIAHPAAQDELYELLASLSIFGGGPLSMPWLPTALDLQPHLFQFLHAAAFFLLGEGVPVARLAGALVQAALAAAVFASVVLLSGSRGASRFSGAAIAAVTCAVMPLMVQGGINLHPEGSLLALLLLCCAFFAAMFSRSASPAWGAAYAAGLALALWARLVSPVLLTCAVLAWLLARKGGGAALRFASWACAGLAAFGLSWLLYGIICGVDPAGPFRYLAGTFRSKLPGAGLSFLAQPAQALAYLFLWTGGLFWAALAAQAAASLRRKPREHGPEELYLFCGAALLLPYLFVGGNTFGFPKYHVAGVAALCVFSGLRLAAVQEGLAGIKAPLLAAVTALASWLAWGDPIFLLRYSLRSELASGGSGWPAATGLAVGAALLFAFSALALLAYGAGSFKRGLSGLPWLAAGSALGISSAQTLGGYQTNYSYGAELTREAAGYAAAAAPPGSRIIAVAEVLRLAGRPPEEYISDRDWNNGGFLLDSLRSESTAAVVYGVAFNTLEQVRSFESEGPLRAELDKRFELSRIGTSSVWIRRSASASAATGNARGMGKAP